MSVKVATKGNLKQTYTPSELVSCLLQQSQGIVVIGEGKGHLPLPPTSWITHTSGGMNRHGRALGFVDYALGVECRDSVCHLSSRGP